ncbi:MFS transporter [Nocardia sp. CA2R105]|uniref:MFS transporter n=1 Tax=Nocardia coffeae TaxID=2873381 RepID=UPI001CA66F91|nr:MFS transporter [Nocardia coffeae]MBY8862896.1 MFS transporter [Nocardia coffeae]
MVVIMPSYLTGTLAISMGPELGYTPSALGWLMGARFAAAASASAVAGRWVERFGATGGMRAAVLTVAATSISIGWFVRNPFVFGALFCLNGVALAAVQPAVDIWVARTVSGKRQGLAFGVKQAAVPTAALLAGFAAPVAAAGTGWRAVWLVVGASAVAVGVCLPWRSGGTAMAAATSTGRSRAQGSTSVLVVLAVCFGFGSVAVVTSTTFLVVSLVAAGSDEGGAGAVLAASSAVAITARLVLGYWADRIRGDLLVILCGFQVVGAVAFLMLGLVSGAGYLIAAPVAFALGLGWPGLLLLVVVRENARAPGAATGIVNTGSYIGSIAGPAIFGLLAARFGYSAGWLFTASCLLAAAMTALAGRALLRRATGRIVPVSAVEVSERQRVG